MPAWAQPAVNPGALDALQPAPKPRTPRPDAGTRAASPPASSTTAPARPAAPRPAPPRSDNVKPAAKPTAPAAAAIPSPPKPPTVPVAPPAIAAIPPAVAVPVQRPPDPPPIPVTAGAPGATLAIPAGVRTTFGPDRSDLNPETEAALRSFARPLRDTAQAVNVLAYAAGSADDPSTPRRLSLARALAARAVLISEGILSTRIYVRALGPATGDGPPDRVDVSTTLPNAAPSTPGATPGATP